MGRFAVFVDAGYLLQKSVAILSNRISNSRGDLELTNPAGLMKMLIEAAGKVLKNNDLLRVYWYDGVKGSMSAEHKAIVAVEDVQFRAGTINGQGQQKGVDSLIVTDLIELATHHAITDALLVTGDSDLAVGIELAQRRGVRVAVLGVAELNGAVKVHHSQSAEITNIADRVVRIGKAEIAPFLQYKPKLVMPAKAAAPATGLAQPAAAVTTVGTALPKAMTGAPPAPRPAPGTNAPQPAATQPAAAKPAAAQPAALQPAAAQPAALQPAVPQPAAPRATVPGSSKLDASTTTIILKAVDSYVDGQTPPFAKTIVTAAGSIDHSADRGLLFAVFTALGAKKLDPQSKNCARAAFKAKIIAMP